MHTDLIRGRQFTGTVGSIDVNLPRYLVFSFFCLGILGTSCRSSSTSLG